MIKLNEYVNINEQNNELINDFNNIFSTNIITEATIHYDIEDLDYYLLDNDILLENDENEDKVSLSKDDFKKYQKLKEQIDNTLNEIESNLKELKIDPSKNADFTNAKAKSEKLTFKDEKSYKKGIDDHGDVDQFNAYLNGLIKSIKALNHNVKATLDDGKQSLTGDEQKSETAAEKTAKADKSGLIGEDIQKLQAKLVNIIKNKRGKRQYVEALKKAYNEFEKDHKFDKVKDESIEANFFVIKLYEMAKFINFEKSSKGSYKVKDKETNEYKTITNKDWATKEENETLKHYTDLFKKLWPKTTEGQKQTQGEKPVTKNKGQKTPEQKNAATNEVNAIKSHSQEMQILAKEMGIDVNAVAKTVTNIINKLAKEKETEQIGKSLSNIKDPDSYYGLTIMLFGALMTKGESDRKTLISNYIKGLSNIINKIK